MAFQKIKSKIPVHRITVATWMSIGFGILIVAFSYALKMHLQTQYSTTSCADLSVMEVDFHPKKIDLGQRYIRIQGCIYHDGHIVYGADARTFKTIPSSHDSYGEDKNYVYLDRSRLNVTDVESFEPLNAKDFSKDKNVVFYQNKVLPDADPTTFEVIDSFHAKDKDSVYQYNKFRTGIYKIEGADSATFEVLETTDSYHPALRKVFSRDGNNVYHQGSVVKDADPATFQVLDESYAKDINSAYRYTHRESDYRKLENVDAQTFEVISYRFTKDKDFVYFSTVIVEDIDPATFEIINNNEKFIKDARHVYYTSYKNVQSKENGRRAFLKIEGADPATFEVLDDSRIKDDTTVYQYSVTNGVDKIEDADPRTFEIIDKRYAKDANNVYLGRSIVQGADPITFQVIKNSYAKDKDFVYQGTVVVDGADPATFELTHSPDYYWSAIDKDHVFIIKSNPELNRNILTILEEADPATFETLDGFYAKDTDSVFYFHRGMFNYSAQVIDGADPATFEVLKSSYAKDKNSVYLAGTIVEEADPETFTVPE